MTKRALTYILQALSFCAILVIMVFARENFVTSNWLWLAVDVVIIVVNLWIIVQNSRTRQLLG